MINFQNRDTEAANFQWQAPRLLPTPGATLPARTSKVLMSSMGKLVRWGSWSRLTRSFFLFLFFFFRMEDQISNAILALEDREYTSIRACAFAFQIPKSTLITRVAGTTSRVNAHSNRQNSSPGEERVLIKTILPPSNRWTRLVSYG